MEPRTMSKQRLIEILSGIAAIWFLCQVSQGTLDKAQQMLACEVKAKSPCLCWQHARNQKRISLGFQIIRRTPYFDPRSRVLILDTFAAV